MNSRASWPGTSPLLFVIALAAAVAAPHLLRDANGVFSTGETQDAAVGAKEGLATGPAAVAGISPSARSPGTSPDGSDSRRFAAIVERASRANGVDAALVHAVIHAESSYDPDARSPAGASGLMQLMPETAKHYGVKDLFDPGQNISGGVKFLRDLLRQFNGNVELALAAYNAGSTAVIRAGHRIPPLAETQAYVPKVIDHYRRLRAVEG